MVPLTCHSVPLEVLVLRSMSTAAVIQLSQERLWDLLVEHIYRNNLIIYVVWNTARIVSVITDVMLVINLRIIGSITGRFRNKCFHVPEQNTWALLWQVIENGHLFTPVKVIEAWQFLHSWNSHIYETLPSYRLDSKCLHSSVKWRETERMVAIQFQRNTFWIFLFRSTSRTTSEHTEPSLHNFSCWINYSPLPITSSQVQHAEFDTNHSSLHGDNVYVVFLCLDERVCMCNRGL
jgi:hypothetical protein